MEFRKFLLFAKDHRIAIHPQTRYIGIIFTLFAWFLLGFATVLFQDSVKRNPPFVTFFFQFASMFLFLLIVSFSKGVGFFKIKERKLVLLRGFIAVVDYYLYSMSNAFVSVVDNSMLFSTDALFIPLFLIVFLGIKVHVLAWIGIIIGFLGVGFVCSFDIQLETIAGIVGGSMGIISGLGLATIVILTSYMVKRDPPLRIALYQALIGVILSGLLALPEWQTPSTKDILFMIYGGLFFSVALFLFLDAFFYTESYIIGVLGYSLVLFVEVINWIVYQETTHYSVIVGSGIICLGGVVTILTQYRLDKNKKCENTKAENS